MTLYTTPTFSLAFKFAHFLRQLHSLTVIGRFFFTSIVFATLFAALSRSLSRARARSLARRKKNAFHAVKYPVDIKKEANEGEKTQSLGSTIFPSWTHENC